jgi:predicted metalloprotease with PDZ domain
VSASCVAAVRYGVRCADLNAHLFDVTLAIDAPAARQRVSLPAWIPGSYLVREFARNLQGLQATQGRRKPKITQQDKASWLVECAPGQPLTLRYQVCAYDPSVRTAWLDADRGFFNATSLCLRVDGQTDAPCALHIDAPAQPPAARWSCATALRPLKTDRHGFGLYAAADYDELADSPVELGAFWSAEFDVLGVPHRFVVAGATAGFDGDRLIADTRAICETQMRFWHGPKASAKARGNAQRPPHDRYVFLLNAVADSYGGLEHRHSTALICNRADLPQRDVTQQAEGYTTLLGLISHEYFHTWNVKRLRPAEFARYDYAQENYTQLLWFFEGFTSYYDDLLLRRAGRIDDAAYLKLLNKTANQVLQAPGRFVQSVAQASFDAWVKYYRQDAQTPNTTISYYTKGALVALCLDLTLRREGHGTLDDVMRLLWSRHAGPVSESDIAAALDSAPTRPNWPAGCTARPSCRWPSCCAPTASPPSTNPPSAPRPWAYAWPNPMAACRCKPCCAAARPSRPASRRRTNGWAWNCSPCVARAPVHGAWASWTNCPCTWAARKNAWLWSRATSACCGCR